MKRPLFISTFVILHSTMASHGAMTLLLNTSTKEFAFTGSDTGIPNTDTIRAIRWFGSHSESAPNSSITFDTASAFITSSGMPEVSPHDTRIAYFGGSIIKGIVIELRLEDVDTSQPSTVTGTGVFQSYAGLSASAIANLESYIGSTIAHSPGNSLSFGGGVGYSELTVVAVPEPGSTALLGLGTVGFILRRRR